MHCWQQYCSSCIIPLKDILQFCEEFFLFTHYTDPCVNVSCAIGYRCNIYQLTHEAYCEPSCTIDNGGCPDGFNCRIEDVSCEVPPCVLNIICTQNLCELLANLRRLLGYIVLVTKCNMLLTYHMVIKTCSTIWQFCWFTFFFINPTLYKTMFPCAMWITIILTLKCTLDCYCPLTRVESMFSFNVIIGNCMYSRTVGM